MPNVSERLQAETFEIDGLELVVFELALEPTIPECFTRAEGEVARLLCRGLDMSAIAEQRQVSYRTISNQLASMFRKLNVHSSSELVAALYAAVPLG